MSNDKKTSLKDINKQMESIRKLTEPYKKIIDAINNPAIHAQKELVSKFSKIGESIQIPKFNEKKKNSMIGDAFKNNDLWNINEPLKRTIPKITIPSLDNRSRAERREDFETEILKIDQKKIKLLIDVLKKVKKHEDIVESEITDLQENVINTLTKYERTISTFEALNSDLAVQLDYKKNELKFTAKADWKNKFRLFFFRVLWTLLFVSSLFAVGYIEQEYEWAHLPMSKYFDNQNMSVKK